MGVVYKAVDPESGELVALKTIRPSRASSTTSRRRFLQEVDAVIQIDHPHILHIIEDGEDRGVPYYVMTYVEGQSLDQYLSSGNKPGMEWIISTAYKIALALQHIHERGLVHLDVKPSNILIDAEGEPFLSDFGIARQIIQEEEVLDGESETAGTPLYMSPEQVLAPAQVDQRADVYSLGILLYEALTGVRPFRGHGTEDVLTRVLFCDPISPRMLNNTLPAAVEKVVLKAMDKCVTKRYQTALELAQDLKRLMVRLAMQRRIHAHETAVDLPAVKRN